jgi:hypothetical protein
MRHSACIGNDNARPNTFAILRMFPIAFCLLPLSINSYYPSSVSTFKNGGRLLHFKSLFAIYGGVVLLIRLCVFGINVLNALRVRHSVVFQVINYAMAVDTLQYVFNGATRFGLINRSSSG